MNRAAAATLASLLAAAVSCLAAGAARGGGIQAPILRFLEARSSAKAPPTLAGPQVTVLPDGRLLVWVTLREGAPASWAPDLPGVETGARSGPFVQVRIPPEQVRALAERPEVLYLSVPPHAWPLGTAQGAIVSEGVAGMLVPEFEAFGGTGDGVRIGILDVGFGGYEQLLGSELPVSVTVRSFFDGANGNGDITGGGIIHGTACAELVHDVAPGAQLYLTNVATPGDLQSAATWLIDQGVEVISHSVGWFFGPGDGTGIIDDIAVQAVHSGVLWVNASGNFAEGHWQGTYTDANANKVADLAPSGREYIRLVGGGPPYQIAIVLLWDRWPVSPDLSFEIDLLSAAGDVLASSEDSQAGTVYAYREVDYQTSANIDTLRVRVRNTFGNPQGTLLRIYRTDGPFAPADNIPEGSIAMPADAPEVLSVGAYAWNSEQLEPFSSFGPNTAGYPKPELLGPDRVSTATYGTRGFAGTSAACPHVAGTAGLLLGASLHGGLFDARWSLDDVKRIFQSQAQPISTNEPGAIGWGLVRMPGAAPLAASATRLVMEGPPAGRTLRLRLLQARSRPGDLQIFDVQGRMLARVAAEQVLRDAADYRVEASALPVNRGRYWAREPVSGAVLSFYWPWSRP